MVRPLVSVIIPAHNEELLLAKCLQSLADQKEAPPFETIVVDNNSTDRTAQIARSFGAHVVQEKKPGPTAARNRGVAVSHAEILIFLDADCIVAPRHVSRIHKWFTANNSRQAAAGAYDFYDADVFIRWFTKKSRLYFWYYRILRKFFGVQVLLSGNFAIRKAILLSVGGFNEQFTDITRSEDTELAIRLRRAGIRVQFFPAMTVRSSHRRIKRFDIRDQFSRISTHFGYLFHYKWKNPTG